MSKTIRIALFLLALLLVAACAPPPELRDPTLLQDQSLLTVAPSPAATEEADATPAAEGTPAAGDPVREGSVIEGEAAASGVCAPPCWRGIVPGVTAWRDALTIIEDDETLENMQIQSSEESAAVLAEFQNVGGTQPCCRVFSNDGRTVDAIFLQVAPNLTLEQVIGLWGEPAYSVGTPFSDGQALMNLIYPDVPMVIVAFVAGEQGSVTGASEIVGLWYMKQSDMDVLIGTNPLHFWEGYDAFTAYDNEEGSFDTTPFLTLTPTSEPTAAP